MSTQTVSRPARNGVDVPTLFATLDAAKAQPELATFQFRASNRWINGTHRGRRTSPTPRITLLS